MKKKIISIIVTVFFVLLFCFFLGYFLNCFIKTGFSGFRISIALIAHKDTFLYFGVFCLVAFLIALLYYYKHYWIFHSKNIIKGKEHDKHLLVNLEQSHFQSKKELEKNFKTVDFKDLKTTEISGIPIMAKEQKDSFKITFSPPSHALVIGTTGSGKTTAFVNPAIQILAASKTKPSMLISDPKGELYQSHAKTLKRRGYKVKVLDLRHPYHSVRWNPLERAYLNYQRMLRLEEEVITREEKGCFEFDGAEYYEPQAKDSALQVKRQQLYDEVYEDIHDITTVLCPINNKSEPMWESGARNLILSIALAMLEDSENPDLKLTKEKYNFYSITKVATNTDNDCAELRNYFRNRSPLSKAVSLSKQVMDSSDKTRGSYLSSVFDKLSMFSDLSLCGLTSSNEIEFGEMGEKPIALFLQIPDEKETRHILAAMVILQAYKELVYAANTYKNLTLPRPVYFILDEFGNLPKIEKLEQMITVGRSRNIWLNLVVQSYAQLAKVYDDKSADIIKSNCNTQIFIGTTDYKTIEEYSKRCGNFSMAQRSVGFNSSKADDINSNTSIKERPLIYPSELQLLNCKGNMGNAIVTVFGYYPIRSKFTPSYASTYFKMEQCDQKLAAGRYFDEAAAFYDLRLRNEAATKPPSSAKPKQSVREQIAEKRRVKLMLEKIQDQIRKDYSHLLDDEEQDELSDAVLEMKFDKAIIILEELRERAQESEQPLISDIIERLIEINKGGKLY